MIAASKPKHKRPRRRVDRQRKPGKQRRDDPANKSLYEDFRRKHPLDRLRDLMKPFQDAFLEFCVQSEKEFRSPAEETERTAAVNFLTAAFHEMQRCGTNILAAAMLQERDQFKLL